MKYIIVKQTEEDESIYTKYKDPNGYKPEFVNYEAAMEYLATLGDKGIDLDIMGIKDEQ